MKLPNRFFTLSLCLLALPAMAQKAKTAEIRMLDGAPALLVDGQPELPFLYALTHVGGGRWSWEELPAHNLRNNCADGIHLFQVDLWFEDIWLPGRKKLDIDLARRQVRGVLDACPGAGVVVRLHVNAPMWWNRAHPEECVQFANGPVEDYPTDLPFNHEDGDIYRSVRASLASVRWRDEAGTRVAEFCRRLSRTPEGRSVIGIHVAGGVYGEWHPFGFFRHEPDVSPPMQQAFRRWLSAKYHTDENLRTAWRDPAASLAAAAVPDTTVRRCCAEGVFRDPAREQYVLDYYRCQQAEVVTDIEHFCRIVKQSWGRPLITGVFYGYLHFALCREAMGGHLEVERLLNSPWVDYFAGPTSYNRLSREAGGSGLERGIVRSALLRGKLWFDEIDNGYLQNKQERDYVRSNLLNDTAYLAILQRSLWLPLVQGCGLWLYDFGPRRNTGWWDSPLYRAEIRRTRTYFEQARRQKPGPSAEVLVVWDTDSYYYTENVFTKTCELGLDNATDDLLRCGVPTDHYYFFDLPLLDLHAYKVVVFMNAWKLTPGQRQFIRDSVATGGRTLVWNYLPGYLDGQEHGKALVEAVTGISLQEIPVPDTVRWTMGAAGITNPEHFQPLLVARDPAATAMAVLVGPGAVPVVVRKQLAGCTSILASVPLHGSAVFRQIFREAGCTVWNENNDLTLVSGRYLLLHDNEGGRRTLHLKSGKSVDLDLPAPATLLLDAETGAVLFRDR